MQLERFLSAPLAWSELTEDLDARAFTVPTVPARVDPWDGFFEVRQRLPRQG